MDRRTEVERWLALRDREHLTYLELSQRSGIPANTLTHWAWRLRRERLVQPAAPAFVELVQTASPPNESGSRVEIILRGERRVVVDASIDADALVRVLAAVDRC
ncbi:MAG: hypothetical protein JNK02_04615 [Planctomycetes bacterium]|nr:hypothetical protein [Planctomycetota bacterium]